jgi:hypothetical protein
MFDARNIAKPLTTSKSKKDEVLYWRDIDALSRPKQQKKPAKSKAKPKRKIRPIHDTNTVTLRLSADQIAAVQCATEQYHKLILALITHNIQQRYVSGAYLDRAALQRLTRKTGFPEAMGLPDGAGQMAAQLVWRMFIRYTCSAGKTEYNPSLLDDPARYSLYLRDIAAKQGRLRLPTIGWVSYLAPAAVTGLFQSNGINLKGAYLALRNKLWRAEICFQRLNEKQIREDVGMAKALARGDLPDDDEHDRDLCLIEVALDVAQERGLLFTQHLPTRLIIKNLGRSRFDIFRSGRPRHSPPPCPRLRKNLVISPADQPLDMIGIAMPIIQRQICDRFTRRCMIARSIPLPLGRRDRFR